MPKYSTKYFRLIVKSNQNRCNLPSWMLRHHRYHNLNETTHYHFNKKGTSLTISQSNDDSAEEESKTLKCNTILEDTGNYSQMIMQVNFEWYVLRIIIVL